MFEIGLKLWSSNTDMVHDALRLFREGHFQYVELFSVPGSFEATATVWRGLPIPYVIHAPHAMAGLNFAKADLRKNNRALAEESLRFADLLGADKVIFHTGLDGELEETVRQINRIGDSRMVVENKPYYGLNDEICVGSTPEEIARIMKETGKRFCIDFGHSICAANAKGEEPVGFIKRFLDLGPCMYHLTDGDYFSIYDRHDHYGEGSYPIKEMLALIPDEAMITNEAKRDEKKGLLDIIKDSNMLQDYGSLRV